jgi:hypothetical protein
LCKTRAWILLRLRLGSRLRVCGWLLVVCAHWPSIRSGHSRGESRWLFFVVCVHWRSICGRHGGQRSSWLLVVCVYWRSIHSGHAGRRSKWMLVVLFVVCPHRRGIHGRHGRRSRRLVCRPFCILAGFLCTAQFMLIDAHSLQG